MRNIIIVLTFTMFSCASRTTESVGVGSKDSVAPGDKSLLVNKDNEEDFYQFFKKFKTDSLFQISRVKFPWTFKYWVTGDEKPKEDYITMDNWKHLNFHYEQSYATRPVDAYTQKINKLQDTVRIELRGVDNGIYIDFDFVKEKGNWVLVTERDYSN